MKIVLGLVCLSLVTWLIYRIYWCIRSVKLHRWLLKNDSFYRHLHEMEESDRAFGFDGAEYAKRKKKYFLMATAGMNMLTVSEYEDPTKK